MELLEDPALTEPLQSEVEVTKRNFTNRLEAGKFFNDERLYNETRDAVAQLKVSAEKISAIADDSSLSP